MLVPVKGKKSGNLRRRGVTHRRTVEGGTIQARGKQQDNARFWNKGRKLDNIRPRKRLGLLHSLYSFLRGIHRREVSVTIAHLWAPNCPHASDTTDVAEKAHGPIKIRLDEYSLNHKFCSLKFKKDEVVQKKVRVRDLHQKNVAVFVWKLKK